MTAREAATLLDIPVERLHQWLKDGILPGMKVGGHWRIPAIAVHELARGGRLRGASRRLDPRYPGNSV
jgi:excisionase family DNA binding protein